MNRINVSIIIVSYNSGEFLKECIDSIVETLEIKESRNKGIEKLRTEIIVVDNNSTDRSVEQVKNLKIKIIQNKNNLGFAKANNQGVKIAKGEYILFLNPDTVVLPGAIEQTFNFLKSHNDVGIATCRLELADGTLDESCHRGFPTPWNALCHFSGLEKLFTKDKRFSGYTLGYLLDNNKPHEVDSCAGAFLMIKRKLGKRLGWWDEDYFWYGEDLDFCYRVKEAGYKVYFLPQVKIIHYGGVTAGIKKHIKGISKASLETKLRSVKASTGAMKIFYRKHYLGKYPEFVTWLVFFGIYLMEKLRVMKVESNR